MVYLVRSKPDVTGRFAALCAGQGLSDPVYRPPLLEAIRRGRWSHAALCVRVSYTFQSPERTLSTYSKGEITIVQIVVRDNNVEQALKALKKKMQREGTFREMKRRNHYEKPSEKKARQKAEAIRRARKLARKRAQREGLLPKRGGGSARR